MERQCFDFETYMYELSSPINNTWFYSYSRYIEKRTLYIFKKDLQGKRIAHIDNVVVIRNCYSHYIDNFIQITLGIT